MTREYAANGSARFAKRLSGTPRLQRAPPPNRNYLGWMYLTGTAIERNPAMAFRKLAQACFLHNNAILIDGEGCHFLG